MTGAMIQLSPRGNVIYQFLSLTVSLLLLYAVGFLLSAVYQLPANPLADLVSAERIDAFASQMFKLAVLTGYLGAGIMMAGEALNVLAVMWWRRIWTVVAVLTVALSISEFSHLLDSATALVLLFLLACSVRAKARTIFFRVWQIGMLLDRHKPAGGSTRRRRDRRRPRGFSSPCRLCPCWLEHLLLADAAL